MQLPLALCLSPLPSIAAAAVTAAAVTAAGPGAVLDPMDALNFRQPQSKGRKSA